MPYAGFSGWPVNNGTPYGVLEVTQPQISIAAKLLLGIVLNSLITTPNPTGIIFDNPSGASGVQVGVIPVFMQGMPVIMYPPPGLQLFSGGLTVNLDIGSGGSVSDYGIQILYR